MKSRKNEKPCIDLDKQAYLIKEGRGRGDLTKYDTTFPFEVDQFNYPSTKINTSNVPQKMGRNSRPPDKNCLILFFAD